MIEKLEKVEPVLKLIAAGLVFFTVVLIGVDWGMHQDTQIFQVIAGILAGFAGGFFSRIKPAQQTTVSSGDTSVHIPPGSSGRVQINSDSTRTAPDLIRPDGTTITPEPKSPQKET